MSLTENCDEGQRIGHQPKRSGEASKTKRESRHSAACSDESTLPSTARSEKSSRRDRQKQRELRHQSKRNLTEETRSPSPPPPRSQQVFPISSLANKSIQNHYEHESYSVTTDDYNERDEASQNTGSLARKLTRADSDRHKMFVRQISTSGSIASRITRSTPVPGTLQKSLSVRGGLLRAHPSMPLQPRQQQQQLQRGLSSSNVTSHTGTTSSKSRSDPLRPHPSMPLLLSGNSNSAFQNSNKSMNMLESYNLTDSFRHHRKPRRQSSISHQRSHGSQRHLTTTTTTVTTPLQSPKQSYSSKNSQRHLLSPNHQMQQTPISMQQGYSRSPKHINHHHHHQEFTVERSSNDDARLSKGTTSTTTEKDKTGARSHLLKKTMALAARLVSNKGGDEQEFQHCDTMMRHSNMVLQSMQPHHHQQQQQYQHQHQHQHQQPHYYGDGGDASNKMLEIPGYIQFHPDIEVSERPITHSHNSKRKGYAAKVA